jgi:hypothetical protein
LVKRQRIETNQGNLEIDTFINNLCNNNVKNKHNYINNSVDSHNSDVIYLSKRLLNFLLASDYIITNTMEYTKLYNQIRSLIDHYHFKNVKNTDNEIYNELKKIIQASHIVKGKLITNFIKMYTSTQQEININL